MKKLPFFIILFLYNFLLFAQTEKKIKVEYFETLSNIQIRALEVYSDSVVWFAAYRGVWGYTEDAGQTWHIDSIKNEKSELHFRSMAVLNDSTVLVLSIASPALLYKTTNKGKSWKVVYQNNHKDAFFDCIKFYDEQNGYALGDPIDGCIQLLKSTDGGENWKNVNCEELPQLADREAFFATSNTNMEILPPNIWIASGGFQSKIYRSTTFGKEYIGYKSPLPRGEQMSGIFSMDFYDKNLGAIAGGHYDKRDSIFSCLAITLNGGKTWEPISFTKPLFGSCVQFRNEKELYLTGHSGTVYVNLKTQKYNYLKDQDQKELKFHTLRISPSKKYIWLAGVKGQIAKFNY